MSANSVSSSSAPFVRQGLPLQPNRHSSNWQSQMRTQFDASSASVSREQFESFPRRHHQRFEPSERFAFAEQDALNFRNQFGSTPGLPGHSSHATPSLTAAPQSLAALAAAEHSSRRRMADQFARGASGIVGNDNCAASALVCTSKNKHVLIMVDASQADASRWCAGNEKGGNDAQAALETVTFTVRLPTPMTDLIAHRLVNGQVRSWEIDLLLRCQRDPKRVEALIEAPVNAAPIVGEDRYVLGISETYPITNQNRTIRFDISASAFNGGCPALDLPLTLVQLESVAWFATCLDNNSNWEGARVGEESIVYIFRTRQPHGYVPGLLFFFVSSGCTDFNDCNAPRDADRFLVLDATQCGDECFEFLALRCCSAAENDCNARRARIFDPFDQECRFPRCGRLHVDVPVHCQECLRGYECPCPSQSVFCPVPVENENSHCLGCMRFDCAANEENGEAIREKGGCDRCSKPRKCCCCAYLYIPPPNTPTQVALLVNGVLDHIDEPAYDALSIVVDYDPLIDQFNTRVGATNQTTPSRSLFGDRCGGAQTLNFPLARKTMVASELTPEARQQYLQRTLSHFYYFPVQRCVNDRFYVRFECAESQCLVEVVVPPANYAARFFVQALQTALDEAFKAPNMFSVRYELFDTEQLVQAQLDFCKQQSCRKPATSAMFAPAGNCCPSLRTGPYTSLTFCIFIESTHCNLFSLQFDCSEQSRAFARMIDYDPQHRYQLQTAYAGNALAPGGCSAAGCGGGIGGWFDFACKAPCCVTSGCNTAGCVPSTADYCAPAPRRTYTARVDPATTFVTLEQRIQRPFQVSRLGKSLESPHCGVRYQIVPSAQPGCNPQPLFCAGDVVIVSTRNPLCPPSGALCGVDEVLDVIVSEQRYDEFTLGNDPFPQAQVVWIWTAPVGFNVHLHRAEPPSNDSAMSRYDAEKGYEQRKASQSSVVSRWLGFASPATKSGAFCYTSDQFPASIVDESLLVRVPSLLCVSESRNTLYSPVSPFDNCVTEFYAQLVLDRNAAQYRTYPSLTSPQPQLPILQKAMSGQTTAIDRLTVSLVRPDGTVYHACGYDLNLTFELTYVNK
jgi:hypothetical protein